ncbi:hypothetical protein GYB59_11985 [bacterium]|nr:hypothetical protein [bacterium]
MSEFQHSAEFVDDAIDTTQTRPHWSQRYSSWVSPARPFCFFTLIATCITGAWFFNQYLADNFEIFGRSNVQAAEAVDPNFYEVVARPGHTSVLARRLDGAIIEIDLKGDKLVYRMVRETENQNAETVLLDGDGHLPLCIEPGYSKDYVLQADNMDGLRVLHMPRNYSLMTGTVVNDGSAAVLCLADERDPHNVEEWTFKAHLVDLNTGKLLAEITLDDFAFDVDQNRRDGSIYIASRAGIYSWKTNEKTVTPLVEVAARSLKHDHRTNRLLIGGFSGELLCFIDNEVEWACPLGRTSAIKAIALSPENPDECLVAGEFEQIVRIDLMRGLPKATIERESALVNGMAYSRNGQHLYVAQSNSHLAVWAIDHRIPNFEGQL